MAGGCPAASHFLLSRQKKVTQEKATLFEGAAQIMVAVRIDRDGRLFWNYMHAIDKKMNGHGVGELVYAR